jgi:hypothetical protein
VHVPLADILLQASLKVILALAPIYGKICSISCLLLCWHTLCRCCLPLWAATHRGVSSSSLAGVAI